MGAKAESDIKHFALEAQLLSLVFLCIFLSVNVICFWTDSVAGVVLFVSF